MMMMVVVMLAMMMGTTEIMFDAFVLQVWLNINWFWVGGGLFPLTW